MRLWSDGFLNGQRIPARYAFGRPDSNNRIALSDNLSPHLAWSELPAETKSLVLICHDPDVPSRPDDVNQEGREVAADLPRVEFFHWVLIDVVPAISQLAEGEFSRGITPHGKAATEGPRGTRQGLNDYTGWFAGDEQMKGDYFGYDGPCPPWNDPLLHHYHFTLYATDLERCPLQGKFRGPEVRAALEGHVLDSAVLVGTYAIHPNARG